MRPLFGFFLLFLAFVPYTCAQTALLSAIEDLPPCALQCLTTAISNSPCKLTDQACICGNAELQGSVEACVLQSCTVKQGLTTKNITMTTCGASVRDRSQLYKTINITLGVISAVFVLVRIIYKTVATISELGWDDYFILITLVVGVPSTIITDRATLPNGLGKDVWTVPFENITRFVRWFYVLEILYFAQVTLLKLSLLFFYHRIFPGVGVRRVVWATIVFNVIFGLVFVFVGIFQCRPISFYWDSWDGEHAGTCININALAWANAGISIALDIWMLAIPLSQLVHLRLAWKKKIGVAMMFCVGTFVTVVSILRLQSLVHFASSQNPTWDQWDVASWSTIEINVGLICTCMPAIRVVLVRIFPNALGSTRNASNQYYAKYGSRSGATAKGAAASNGLNSGLGKARNGITFTKTFEVQHSERDKEGDEIGLVEMDDFGGKVTRLKSASSSHISL